MSGSEHRPPSRENVSVGRSVGRSGKKKKIEPLECKQ